MGKKKSPVEKAVRGALGKATAAVKRRVAGEKMCESCRVRMATAWSNRMHQCGHCVGAIRRAGGGKSYEHRNRPRNHSLRAV